MIPRMMLSLTLAVVSQAVGGQPGTDWIPIIEETFGYGPDTPATVDLDRLEQGCPRRDCIPAIDAPSFVPAGEAAFLADGDLVLALSINGDSRAYPANILNAHEIVNDSVGGEPVAITYCPLCGSGLAFRRELDGQVLEFGVSGLLHENDLVMYDRRTESLWQQITGEAIAGPKAGSELDRVPLTMTEWRRWREAHPATRVLTGPKGSDAEYARDRYADYARSDRLLFPVTHESERLHRKDVVYGFEPGDRPFAVPAFLLEDRQSIHVEHEGARYRVIRDEAGTVVAKSDNGAFPATRLYWFAWYTFHPDTELIVDPAH